MKFEHKNDEVVIPININMAREYFIVLDKFKRNEIAQREFVDFCCLTLGKMLEQNRSLINKFK